jgi:hypothetical protein
MRRFLTIGITTKGNAKVLHGPEKEKHEHRAAYRKLVDKGRKAKKGKADFAEVLLIDTGRGVVKRKKFDSIGKIKFRSRAPVQKRSTVKSGVRRVGATRSVKKSARVRKTATLETAKKPATETPAATTPTLSL